MNKIVMRLLWVLIIIFLCFQPLSAQWVQISTIPTSQLNAVKFFNFNTGITAGYGGIWRTTNGGFNWTHTLQTGRFNAISFTDSINGTAVGDSGIIYRTSDNGINWITES